MLNYVNKNKNIFAFYHQDGAGSSYFISYTTRARLSNVFNSMASDDLPTHGRKASTVIVLT